MTKLYLDTEFTHFGGKLISLALVENPDSYWYGVLPLPDKSEIDPWVIKNVIPILGQPPMRPLEFKAGLWQFLSQFKHPTIVCDWYEDATHFLSQFAGSDYGSSFRYKCDVSLISANNPDPQPAVPHNALSDAIALWKWDQDRSTLNKNLSIQST